MEIDCCLAIIESLNSVYRQGSVAEKYTDLLEITIVEGGSMH